MHGLKEREGSPLIHLTPVSNHASMSLRYEKIKMKRRPSPQVIKLFFMLNAAEYEI